MKNENKANSCEANGISFVTLHKRKKEWDSS